MPESQIPENEDLSPDLTLPPASFSFLIESIMMQTQIQLGLFNTGESGEEEPNLPIARHSIDLLAVLQEKTRGNLTAEEHRLLENGLTELRFRFVQVTEELNRKQEPSTLLTSAGGKGFQTA